MQMSFKNVKKNNIHPTSTQTTIDYTDTDLFCQAKPQKYFQNCCGMIIFKLDVVLIDEKDCANDSKQWITKDIMLSRRSVTL